MLHPFPLFLSLSSFSFCITQAPNTTHIHIYIYVIYLCDVRYIDKHSVFLFHSFALLCFFVLRLCVASIRFRSVLCLFLFIPQPTHPHPTFTVQNRWLPHSLIFLFFRFQNFFVEKMRYDLFTFMECLCRY